MQPRYAPFVLPDSPRVVATEVSLQPLARVLRGHLERLTGRPFEIGSGAAKSGDFLLTLGYLDDGVKGNREACGIEVFSDHVALSGETEDGVARAAARVLQLFSYNPDDDSWSLPPVRVDDAPTLPWRGLELDVARFPHPIGELREAVDLAFLYSLNTVHLHLSDDQAFTFPASCLPERTDAGLPGKNRGYTREELVGLVEYAAARGVVLIPEIDMPAHASSLVRARPDLFGTPDVENGGFRSTQIINVCSEAAYEAVGELLAEVADVFELSPRIHLGGDEVWEGHIKALPELLAYTKTHGLLGPDHSGCASELLNHFLVRTSKTVRELGRQAVVWEGFRPPALKKNALGTDVIVMSWSQHSQQPGALIAQGYSIVNCGWDPLYVVPAQGWAARPSEAYDWTPSAVRQRFGGRVTQLAVDAPLLGSQVCMWEQRPESIVPALNRVLPELSTRLWGSRTSPDLADFEAQSAAVRSVVERVLRPVAFDVEGTVSAAGTLFQDKVSIAMRSKSPGLAGTIRYRVGQSFDEPMNIEETKVAGPKPVVLSESSVLSAALFNGDGGLIGGVTRVRFEKGVPVLSFEARELTSGGPVNAATFESLWDPEQLSIGSGVLAAPDRGRIEAINRELFAKVVPKAHVDLRPLSFDVVGEAQRIDALRPRIWGRHIVRAAGQITIPKEGEWSVSFSSRSGLARVRIGGADVSAGADRSSAVGKLQAGTYVIEIEQVVPNVHNDLQLTLQGPGDDIDRPVYEFLRPIAEWVKVEELSSATNGFD